MKQSSEYRGNDRWTWSVWLDAPSKVLNEIESVTYKLHSSFPDRVREHTNAAEKFRLTSEGWGEFTITAEVKPKHGGKFTKRHWLTLEYPRSGATAQPRGAGSVETKEKARSSTVFLSAGLSDLRMANALAAALTAEGLKVLKSDDLSAGLPWEVTIGNMIKSADLMVVLISGMPTSWIVREIDAAVQRKLEILPIVIGPSSMLPEQILSLQRINLKEANDPEKIAPNVTTQIMEKLKTLPPRTK